MTDGDDLTEREVALLRRHLPFYVALATGERRPTTAAQRRFVLVTEGRASPRTDHEHAYLRFRALSAQGARRLMGGAGPVAARSLVDDPGLSPLAEPPRADDATAAWAARMGAALGRLAARARSKGPDLSHWTGTVLADGGVTRAVDAWLAENANLLSTSYSKAMDAEFLKGLAGEAQRMAPELHRLIDGGHDFSGSLRAALAARSDDTLLEALAGWAQAYLSDLASPTGMPLATMTAEGYGRLRDALGALGVPPGWTLDALHVNAQEIVGASVPALAALLCWSRAEEAQFGRLVGGLGLSSVASASPLGVLVFLVAVAYAFQRRRDGGGAARLGLAVLRGGLSSGLVLGLSAAVAGPVWIGLVLGMLVAHQAERMAPDAARATLDRLRAALGPAPLTP